MSAGALEDASEDEGLVGVWLFGKMPAHGDFISRGLDDETIEHSDAVLSEALSLAAARWDMAWDDIYVETPVWRFLATPGVLGHDWTAGIFLASVDAVGRQFPLMAGFSAASLALIARPTVTDAALDGAETLLRQALLDAIPIDAVLARLAEATPRFLDVGDSTASDPVAVFAYPLLTHLEATPWAQQSLWWVAGEDAAARVRMDGQLSGTMLVQLFRAAPKSEPETAPEPGPQIPVETQPAPVADAPAVVEPPGDKDATV